MEGMGQSIDMNELAKVIDNLRTKVTTYKETVNTAEAYNGDKTLSLYAEGETIIREIVSLGAKIGITEDTRIYRSSLTMAETTVRNAMNRLTPIKD